jgi:hypothetical protein
MTMPLILRPYWKNKKDRETGLFFIEHYGKNCVMI